MAKPKNVDEYIAGTEGSFAHPVLTEIRRIVHETAPDIKETIKWGTPSFEYKGLMMSMVSFKKFAAVWFHKGALFNDPGNLLEASSEETKSMRKYIIPTLDDLNEEGLRSLILEAIEKQESGEQVKGYNTNEKWKHSELLFEALEKDPAAREKFEEFAPYKQKEFIEHIETARQDATKQRRLENDLELIRKGIGLHDKYR
ncbi:MAG: DUF1801 domain-containing protein [Balneolaceae bacterium]